MNRAKLNEAARLVAEVAAELNREFKTCECCGFKRFENYDDFLTGKELDAVIRKLKLKGGD
jgi:hypothetical protein